MSEGMARPGGRSARVRAAVVRAVGDALIEVGLSRLDLADVARRAGVGKTTVYRRWGTVAAAVTELVDEMVETSAPRADSGSLETDLRANADLVRSTLADPRQGRLLTALICAAREDDRTAGALRRFYAARVQVWEPCVVEAIARGEVPPDTEPAAVVRAVSAPLYHRLLTAGEVPDDADGEQAVAAAVVAAKAGVFRAR